MWTEKDVAEIFLMAALSFSAPLLFLFFRKLTAYIINRYIPRDTIIDFKKDGAITHSYYIKRRIFRRCRYYKLDPTYETILKRPKE